ncbi:hypothetical protein M1D80_11915 [Phyllobacteriaceae bacterium JZ32]
MFLTLTIGSGLVLAFFAVGLMDAAIMRVQQRRWKSAGGLALASLCLLLLLVLNAAIVLIGMINAGWI